ncbi:MAG: hypothetical protein U0904_00840 [Candidatus Nanopelagicales bacterium]|nr:hypothetical protein [Candidatus Nanopelagicales bacterium]
MATEDECRVAIESLIKRLDDVDPDVRRGHMPDRTIGCTLLDLDLTFLGRLEDGHLVDLHTVSNGREPQIRLLCTSDDLVAMVDGNLKFAHAWATGRIHLDASLRDLLRLRGLA